mmetsp:Transcript_27660/g.50228  ORF Transcript_27660/g.50228 Transcript_27660/m.50228 type:complete len:305 (+) Transcript_27660:167-1081(+)
MVALFVKDTHASFIGHIKQIGNGLIAPLSMQFNLNLVHLNCPLRDCIKQWWHRSVLTSFTVDLNYINACSTVTQLIYNGFKTHGSPSFILHSCFFSVFSQPPRVKCGYFRVSVKLFECGIKCIRVTAHELFDCNFKVIFVVTTNRVNQATWLFHNVVHTTDKLGTIMKSIKAFRRSKSFLGETISLWFKLIEKLFFISPQPIFFHIFLAIAPLQVKLFVQCIKLFIAILHFVCNLVWFTVRGYSHHYSESRQIISSKHHHHENSNELEPIFASGYAYPSRAGRRVSRIDHIAPPITSSHHNPEQ